MTGAALPALPTLRCHVALLTLGDLVATGLGQPPDAVLHGCDAAARAQLEEAALAWGRRQPQRHRLLTAAAGTVRRQLGRRADALWHPGRARDALRWAVQPAAWGLDVLAANLRGMDGGTGGGDPNAALAIAADAGLAAAMRYAAARWQFGELPGEAAAHLVRLRAILLRDGAIPPGLAEAVAAALSNISVLLRVVLDAPPPPPPRGRPALRVVE